MKSFKQFAEDGGAAGVGTATGGVAGAGDNPSNTVPVSKATQKKIVTRSLDSKPETKAPSSGVSNRVGPQNPRKITGAVNMESFAKFHMKTSKIKAADSSVGPQTFMTKEDTLRAQKEIIGQNSKTDENPTGFTKSIKGRLIDIGNQVLNKQKEK